MSGVPKSRHRGSSWLEPRVLRIFVTEAEKPKISHLLAMPGLVLCGIGLPSTVTARCSVGYDQSRCSGGRNKLPNIRWRLLESLARRPSRGHKLAPLVSLRSSRDAALYRPVLLPLLPVASGKVCPLSEVPRRVSRRLLVPAILRLLGISPDCPRLRVFVHVLPGVVVYSERSATVGSCRDARLAGK